MAEKLDPQQVVTFKTMWEKRFPPFFGLITLMVSAFLSLMPLQAAHAQSPSTLWKARALEAAEKIESLSKKIEKMKGESLNSPEGRKFRCESLMEVAYASHLNPLLESIVHKIEGGIDFFKILLNAGEDSGFFDLTYVYEKDVHKATKVMSIPKQWEVIIPAGKKDIAFVLVPDFCTIAISFSNPFFYHVLDK